MSFNILYNGEGDESASLNLFSIAVYLDGFTEGLGLKSQAINTAALQSVVGALSGADFPHVDGCENASPFKKVAYFFVNFVAAKPVTEAFSSSVFGPIISGIENHQNVVLAYLMAVDSLHHAQIYRKNGQIISLDNKILVSRHFFYDFVEAFAAAVPYQHFKIASLLFEQLAYKANPVASYPEII